MEMKTASRYLLLYLVSVITIYLVLNGLEPISKIDGRLILKSVVISIGVVAGLAFTFNFDNWKSKRRTRH